MLRRHVSVGDGDGGAGDGRQQHAMLMQMLAGMMMGGVPMERGPGGLSENPSYEVRARAGAARRRRAQPSGVCGGWVGG